MGDKIRTGPQVGILVTQSLPCRGSPKLESGGQNQKWPTSGLVGYKTPAVLGGSQLLRVGAKIRCGPQVGVLATLPESSMGSPTPHSKGQNQKGPTSARTRYNTTTIQGVPDVSQQGTNSDMAHKWADWLHNPYRSGGSQCLRAGGTIGSGPQVGGLGTLPLPSSGSPMPHSGGQNQKGPTSRPICLNDPFCRGGGAGLMLQSG